MVPSFAPATHFYSFNFRLNCSLMATQSKRWPLSAEASHWTSAGPEFMATSPGLGQGRSASVLELEVIVSTSALQLVSPNPFFPARPPRRKLSISSSSADPALESRWWFMTAGVWPPAATSCHWFPPGFCPTSRSWTGWGKIDCFLGITNKSGVRATVLAIFLLFFHAKKS